MAELFARGHAILPPDGDKGREERGAFYTPDALALAICGTVANLLPRSPRVVLEPGCGGGAFLRAVDALWPKPDLLWGVDLVPACRGPGQVDKLDLFKVSQRCDLIIGNPDFGIAERVVRHCLGLLNYPDGMLALLLRVSFLGSKARVPLYREHPLYAFQPIAGRPSFTGGGSDTSEYGLFVWTHGHRGDGRMLPPLEWKR